MRCKRVKITRRSKAAAESALEKAANEVTKKGLEKAAQDAIVKVLSQNPHAEKAVALVFSAQTQVRAAQKFFSKVFPETQDRKEKDR